VRENLDTTLLQEVPDAVIATTHEGRVLYWNKAAESIFGYARAEAEGRALYELIIPPDRIAEEQRLVREALAEGHASYESLRRRKDGSLVHVDISSKPVYDERGELRFVLSSKKDISHLKVRRDAKLLEARFRGLFDSVPDGILMVNAAGHIVLANRQAEAMFGYGHGALLGSPIDVLLPDRLRARHIRHRAGYVVQPRPRVMGAGLDLYGLRGDGTEFPVEISLSPLQAEEEHFVLSAIRDISERKRIETELRRANLELERASQAKDSFLASMSHELRTPLNAIIGFTGMLLMKLQGPLTADQDRHLRTVQASAKHLLALINDLLDVAKIGAGKTELHLESTVCQQAVQEVVEALRPQAQAKAIELEFSAPPEDLMVKADRRALRQIVLNLVSNAIKFTDRGHVRVRLGAHPGKPGVARVQVADTGRGIPGEAQKSLFEPFSAAGSESRRRGEGTGLGLYVSRRLAELLGGDLEVESVLGRGSTFTLVLPRE
jgi:PAS domain S-box-containing protein